MEIRSLMEKAGKKLDNLRKQLGFDRKEMARHFGISIPAYYKNESGKSFPGVKTLYQLSREHDISMDWLMFDRGPMHFTEKVKDENQEKELDALKKELELAREKAQELEQQLEEERVLRREWGLQGRKFLGEDAKPELKELLEQLSRLPLLYHEVMAQFYRFKEEHREMMEKD